MPNLSHKDDAANAHQAAHDCLTAMLGELTKAHQLDKAAAISGQPAHEVARLETMRNHADLRAQLFAKGGL